MCHFQHLCAALCIMHDALWNSSSQKVQRHISICKAWNVPMSSGLSNCDMEEVGNHRGRGGHLTGQAEDVSLCWSPVWSSSLQAQEWICFSVSCFPVGLLFDKLLTTWWCLASSVASYQLLAGQVAANRLLAGCMNNCHLLAAGVTWCCQVVGWRLASGILISLLSR